MHARAVLCRGTIWLRAVAEHANTAIQHVQMNATARQAHALMIHARLILARLPDLSAAEQI